MASIINTENLLQKLHIDLNKEMIEAAEPFLQESLRKIEIEMRKKLAQNLIALIEHNVNFRTNANEIYIVVKKDGDK